MIDQCLHLIHKKCLAETACQQVKKNNQEITCPKPDCKKQIQDWELRHFIDPEDYQEIEKLVIAQIIAQNSNLSACSCGQ